MKLLPFQLLELYIKLVIRPDRKLRGSKVKIQKPLMYKSGAPLPSYRYEFTSSVLHNEIYCVGGVILPSVWFPTRMVEVYSPESNTWRRICDYPKLVHHAGSASHGERLYVIGGNGVRIIPRDDVYAYDPKINTWTRCKSMPTKRGALGVVSIGKYIYAVGGGANKRPLDTLEAYDPIKDTWEKRKAMPTKREHVAAVGVNGKLYVLGGYAETRFNNLTSNEVYDPSTDSWRKLAPLPYPVSGLSAAAMGESIFIFGGEQGWAASGEVHEYKIRENRWIRRTDLPSACYASTASSIDRNMYIIGGNTELMSGKFSRENDICTP